MSIKEFEETVKNLARTLCENVDARSLRVEICVEPYSTGIDTQINYRSFYEEGTVETKQQQPGGCRD